MIYHDTDLEKSKILSDNKGKAGIYMWTNKESNKRYIGSTFDLFKRLSNYYSIAHISQSKTMYINRALFHHGYSAFSLTIYEEIDISILSKEQAKKFILELEQFYIDSLEPEYNLLKIAGFRLGSNHSEETLAKMRKAMTDDKKLKLVKLCLVRTIHVGC